MGQNISREKLEAQDTNGDKPKVEQPKSAHLKAQGPSAVSHMVQRVAQHGAQEPTSRTRSVVLCGLSIALLAVGAAIVLPLGPIPFTLQTLMLTLVIMILTPKESMIAIGGYLVLGAIGLPIFAGFKGGLGALLGPTGGFLIGFFVATCLIAVLKWLLPNKVTDSKQAGLKIYFALDLLCVVILMLVYYGFGIAWFSFSTGTAVMAALAICVLPFVIPDVIKAVVAFSFSQPIRFALGRSPMPKSRKETRLESGI